MTTTIFPAPGAINSSQLTDTFFSNDVSNVGSLLIYNASPNETDTPIYISSQYNVAYDVAKWYLSSVSNILTKTIRTPIVTQTLYFNNTTNDGAIRYRAGTEIKLTYLGNGLSKIITVKESSFIGITFDIYDGFPIVNTAGLRLVNVTSDVFPRNYRLPSSPTNFPAPGATAATRWEYMFNTNDYSSYTMLSQFDSTDTETDSPVYINGQSNVTYNIPNWYITDANILSPTTKTVGSTQTIYFNNTSADSLKFKQYQKVKISYSPTNFSTVVTILKADSYSVTFNSVVGFPTVNQGPLRVVSVTMDVYPRSKALTDTITKGTKLPISSSARENLAVSETLPNYRSVSFFTDRSFASVDLEVSNSKLESYSSTAITGDKSFAITKQSLDILTSNPSTVSWYVKDLDILTYSALPLLVKTVYFNEQQFIPFITGTTVRIRNVSAGYSRIFTVVLGTTNSVILDVDDHFPTDGSFIDDFKSSVYKQSDVYTTTAPINPRENLFYFNLVPGLRAANHEPLGGSTLSATNGQLNRPMLIAAEAKSLVAAEKIVNLKPKFSPLLNAPALSSLPKAYIKLKSDIPAPTLSFTNKPVTSVRTVATFELKPNLVNKLKTNNYKEIVVSPRTVTTLTKSTRVVRAEPNRLNYEKIKVHVTRIPAVFEPPASTIGKSKLIVKSDTIKINISGILPRVVNQNGIYALSDYSANFYTSSSSAIPSSPIDYLFYSRLVPNKYGISTSPTSACISVQPGDTAGSTLSVTPVNLYAKLNPTGVSTGIGFQSTRTEVFSTINNTYSTTDSLTNFNNVLFGSEITVTGQSNVYDIISWIIYENQLIKSSTPTVGVTQTLYFNNPQLTKLFHTGTYVKISQTSSGFSSTVQLTDTSPNSISFNSIVGFPSSIAAMTIISASSPVYPKALTFAQLLPTGLIKETTLPRENLVASEQLPNIRGWRYGYDFMLGGITDTRSSTRLEVFQDSKLTGDDKLRVLTQTSDVRTLTTNIAAWYTFETNLVLRTTAVATVKTLTFATQLVIPFPAGSVVKLTSGSLFLIATVITGTTNSITIAQPSNPLTIENLYVENLNSSVYTQTSVSIIGPATTPRENLYYSLIRPLNKSNFNAGITTNTLSNGVVSRPTINVSGEPSKLSVSSAKVAIKVFAEPAIITLSATKLSVKLAPTEKQIDALGNLTKRVSKLVSTTDYTIPTIATTSYTPAIKWDTSIVTVTGISGNSTTPTVASWYEFESNIIKSTSTSAGTTILYTGSLLYNGGDRVRILQPTAGFDFIATVISYTKNSVTIANIITLPSISGMYFIWGRPAVTAAVTYSATNATPIITVLKQSQIQIFDSPVSGNVSNQSVKLTSDVANHKSGNLNKQLTKVIPPTVFYPSSTIATVVTTSNVTWYNQPIYVSGISGITTTPSVANWYTFDAVYNTFKQTNANSTNVTLYFNAPYSYNTGDRIQLQQPNAGYNRIFSVIASTATSITVENPKNLPSISGMYFVWGRVISKSDITSTNDNSISVIKAYTPIGSVLFDTTKSGNVEKQLQILKGEPSNLSVSSAKVAIKVFAEQANLSVSSAKVSINVRAIDKPQPVLVPTTTYTPVTKWSDTLIPITGISGNSTTPTVASWYEFESNIIKSTTSTPANITLYFGPSTYPVFGNKIRLVQPVSSYDSTFTVVSYTKTSVTIENPKNLPSISGMYSVWGIDSVIPSVTYNNTNQTAIINKIAIAKIAETANVPQVSKVLNIPIVRGDNLTHTAKSRLETFDNLGFTYGLTVSATQSYENAILITGRTRSATNNVVNWYTYDYNILSVAKIATPATTTLYFGVNSYTIGSAITLVNYDVNYFNTVPVLSSTATSVTITALDLPSSGLYIYISSTLVFPSYASNGFSNYIKLTSSSANYSKTFPVIDRTSYSVTYVKSAIYNTPVSASSFVTIEDASPPVYPYWQSAAVTYRPHDRYLDSLRVSSGLVYGRASRNVAADNNQLASGKVRSSTNLTSLQAYINTSVTSIITVPSITWSSDQLTVTGRSGITTIPSIANWYTRDDIYNSFNVYDSRSNMLTLYFTSTTYISFNRLRIVQPSTNYDRVVSVVSFTKSSATFNMPTDFPTISSMYVYVGIISVTESITISNNNSTPIVNKLPLPQLRTTGTLGVAKVSSNYVVRSDAVSPLLPNVVKKYNQKPNNIFETPVSSSIASRYIVKSVASDFKVSKVSIAAVVKGEASQITARRLETYDNIKGVVENVTTIVSSTDTAILISGRSSTYTSNVVQWYTNDLDILTLTPKSNPSNITLSFVNTTGIAIGSTVTLVQYDTGFFKTVNVLSSTIDSITIANTTLPDSELYIYFGTTVSFAAQLLTLFPIGTNVSLMIPGSEPYTIQILSATTTTVSFVKTFAYVIINNVTKLYSSNLSYFPQSLVINPNRPPINARENLFYGLMNPSSRYKSYNTASTTPSIASVGKINTPLFTLRADNSYKTNELVSSTVKSITKFIDPVAITGIVLNTANTASWYTYDYDRLTTTNIVSANITLYYNAIMPSVTNNNLTVRIMQALTNYIREVTVISITADSITIVNPGDLPSIDTMTMQWGYPSIETSYEYSTTANNVSTFTKFKSSKYVTVDSLSVSSIKQQMQKLVADATKINAEKVNTFSVRKQTMPEVPALSTTFIKLKVQAETTKIEINGITARVANPTSIADYFVNQSTVQPTTKPTLPREYLFYSKLTPGKYGISTDSKSMLVVSLLSNYGRSETYQANPDTYVSQFPTGIPRLGTGVGFWPPIEKLNDVPKLNKPDYLTNYTNVPTNISARIFDQGHSNVVDWYVFETSVISFVYSGSGATQTLYFNNESLDKKFFNGHVVRFTQLDSGYSRTAEVIESTLTTITITTIPDFPRGEVLISSITSPIYSREFTASQMLLKGITRETTLPRENLFASEQLPNLRGVSYFKVNMFGGIGLSTANKLETFDTTAIPGDFRLQVRLQSADFFGNASTVSWFIYELDLLTYQPTPAVFKTLYFDNQSWVPFAQGSQVKITAGNFTTQIVTVLAATTNSIVIAQPTTLFGSDNLYIERVNSSVYQQSSVAVTGPASNARENLYYSLIKPLDKGSLCVSYTNPNINSGTVKNQVPALKADTNKYTVSSTYLSVKVVGEPNSFKGVSKVLTLARLHDVISYPSVSISSSTTTTNLEWTTSPIFITGISGHNTDPTIANWYAFEEQHDTLSVIDSNATYVTLYTGATTLPFFNGVIRIVQPTISYDRVFTVISSTSDSITIINSFDLPSISGMYILWGRNITSTAVKFTNNNRTPLINIIKSMNTYVHNTPQISTLSKQLVKLKSDRNTFNVSVGVALTKLKADTGFLNGNITPVVPVISTGFNLKFNDTTRLVVDSRGQITTFITSNYESITNEQPVQNKETIQFWN